MPHARIGGGGTFAICRLVTKATPVVFVDVEGRVEKPAIAVSEDEHLSVGVLLDDKPAELFGDMVNQPL
ncbi:MAG TPA: hypothetical protein VM286_08720 [Candidatus Thermoplasmatota archaeon]|nr:hypothetical protein [Candidatus Thermoplasmatota archaeon]